MNQNSSYAFDEDDWSSQEDRAGEVDTGRTEDCMVSQECNVKAV